MKRTIICEKVTNNQPKSSSIDLTHDLLLEKFPQAKTRKCSNFSEAKIIEIDGVKIGIENDCDSNRAFLNDDFYDLLDRDIILCASSATTAMTEPIKRIANENDFRLVWITNAREENPDEKKINKLNLLSANHFVDMISQIMNGEL